MKKHIAILLALILAGWLHGQAATPKPAPRQAVPEPGKEDVLFFRYDPPDIIVLEAKANTYLRPGFFGYSKLAGTIKQESIAQLQSWDKAMIKKQTQENK